VDLLNGGRFSPIGEPDMTRLWMRYLLTLSLLVGAGCMNPVDSTVNDNPRAEVASRADDGTTSSGDCECFTPGTWYRFDTLVIVSLDGGDHPVIPTLNPLWEADIKKMELSILLEIVEVTADKVELRAMNAARITDEGDICALEHTISTVIHPRQGCHLLDSEMTAISVYAGSPDHPKNCTTVLPVVHAIPVEQVVLAAEISPECDQIINGEVISGIISQDALFKTCTCLVLGTGLAEECEELEADYIGDSDDCVGCNRNYISLESLLNGFGALAFICKTLDDLPAVCLEATYSAVRLDEAPAFCDF
jgi:hypothetical protein